MVVKHLRNTSNTCKEFESSVISYGSKTKTRAMAYNHWFESSVISYGSKTDADSKDTKSPFESSVISYGSKTTLYLLFLLTCLMEICLCSNMDTCIVLDF